MHMLLSFLNNFDSQSPLRSLKICQSQYGKNKIETSVSNFRLIKKWTLTGEQIVRA